MNTPRSRLFARSLEEPTGYLQHYLDLCDNYDSVDEIYKKMSEEVRSYAGHENEHYKYKIYLELNPNLETSPFLYSLHPLSGDVIRFRLGSHVLPIETGR